MNADPKLKNNGVLKHNVKLLKSELKKFKNMSNEYFLLVMSCERRFQAAWDRHAGIDQTSFIKTKALFEIPLIKIKDHMDYIVGFLDGMLPAFEKDYHPQEPDRDPLAEVKEQFRCVTSH